MDEFEDIVIHQGNTEKQIEIPDGSVPVSGSVGFDYGDAAKAWAGVWTSDPNTGVYRSGDTWSMSFSTSDHEIEFLKMKFLLGQIKDEDAIKKMIEMKIDGLDQCEMIEEWRKERLAIEKHVRDGGSLDQFLTA